jgi:hypothetical protein
MARAMALASERLALRPDPDTLLGANLSREILDTEVFEHALAD